MEQGDEALELQARNKIYSTIAQNPGLHFRELERRTSLAVGSLQYHLDYLEKAHLIRKEKQGKFTRFFNVRDSELGQDEAILSLLRQEHLRKIVVYLLTNKKTTNFDIAKAMLLSPSTISMHLKKLTEANLIGSKRRGRKLKYFIVDPQRVAAVLIGYRKSFLDEIVDNFVNVWQELHP